MRSVKLNRPEANNKRSTTAKNMNPKFNDLNELKILIVAEHASARFGGEAALALHYFRVLRRRGISTWLVVHERTRRELCESFDEDQQWIHFVTDNWLHRALWRLGKHLPAGLASFTTAFGIRLVTQISQRRIVRQLVLKEQISVVHQPMPVSPKEPSLIYDVGAPVIIGPMNGGMDFPLPFRSMQGLAEKLSLRLGRFLAAFLNYLIPGKRRAALLLVANERTRLALPEGVSKNVSTLVENGVNLALWSGAALCPQQDSGSITHFVFMGRLIPLKGVDLLLEAFALACREIQATLTIIGDDIERGPLEIQARKLGLTDAMPEKERKAGKVRFLGWLSQPECAAALKATDVLVLPSLRECGGAVVLEAMALGIPVIATDWGGPADYLDPSCGILVAPISKVGFILELTKAMIRMAKNPAEREHMGIAGQTKVISEFDWEVKVDKMLEFYRQVVGAVQ